MYKIDFMASHHVFPLFISSMISMIACLPLAEFESKLLTVMSSSVPCRNGIPITLITADCSNRVLMKFTEQWHWYGTYHLHIRVSWVDGISQLLINCN